MRSRRRILITLVAMCIGCEAPVRLDAARDAVAGCEPPSEATLVPTARMLPGRVCQACHVRDGQAGALEWTASGTVYARPDAPCNEGGLEGVQVDLLDSMNRVIVTLTTNRSGNFFTAEPLAAAGVRARLSKDGRLREMSGLQGSAACAACHRPGGIAPGRIYLD
jgi:cytochrome c553